MVNEVNKGTQQRVDYSSAKQQKVDVQQAALNQQAATQKPASAQGDSVNLTAQAKQLKQLQEKTEQSSGYDAKKVAELKKAISEGQYQVDANKLAANIAQFEFNLFN